MTVAVLLRRPVSGSSLVGVVARLGKADPERLTLRQVGLSPRTWRGWWLDAALSPACNRCGPVAGSASRANMSV